MLFDVSCMKFPSHIPRTHRAEQNGSSSSSNGIVHIVWDKSHKQRAAQTVPRPGFGGLVG